MRTLGKTLKNFVGKGRPGRNQDGQIVHNGITPEAAGTIHFTGRECKGGVAHRADKQAEMRRQKVGHPHSLKDFTFRYH